MAEESAQRLQGAWPQWRHYRCRPPPGGREERVPWADATEGRQSPGLEAVTLVHSRSEKPVLSCSVGPEPPPPPNLPIGRQDSQFPHLTSRNKSCCWEASCQEAHPALSTPPPLPLLRRHPNAPLLEAPAHCRCCYPPLWPLPTFLHLIATSSASIPHLWLL